MSLAIVTVCSLALLFFVGVRISVAPESRRIRSVLLAQVAAAAASILLLLLHWTASPLLPIPELDMLLSLSALANALAATFGLSVVHYILQGKWHRAFYGLSLLALIPGAGPFIAVLLWLILPVSISLMKGNARDESTILKMHTIFNGTLAAALLMFLLTFARRLSHEPMGLEALGTAAGPLFLHAGLAAKRDPENEFSYREIGSLVRNGILLLLPAAVLPPLLLSPKNFLIFHRFLIPASILLSCAFLLILIFHFEARNIRTFLVLLFLALVPTAMAHLYREQLEATTLQGIRLFSRTSLVLSCLFILRQYMRWGFEIAQTMVMFITAIAFASIVFIIVAIVQPVEGMTVIPGAETVGQAILVLDLVILASLPPLVVNYGCGTMKVTWAILGFGLFLESYLDFLDATAQRHEEDIAAALAYGLIALAFVTLWRYTSVLMSDIRSISHRLDAA